MRKSGRERERAKWREVRYERNGRMIRGSCEGSEKWRQEGSECKRERGKLW